MPNNSNEYSLTLFKSNTNNSNIVNGFGWGVGSAVINGSLEAFKENSTLSETQLIMRPFPQFSTGEKTIVELWHDYRNDMLSLCGIAIFIFGNKSKDGNIINADGLRKEFGIAKSKGVFLIPIASTGYESEVLWNEIFDNFEIYYPNYTTLKENFKILGDMTLANTDYNKLIDVCLEIVSELIK